MQILGWIGTCTIVNLSQTTRPDRDSIKCEDSRCVHWGLNYHYLVIEPLKVLTLYLLGIGCTILAKFQTKGAQVSKCELGIRY